MSIAEALSPWVTSLPYLVPVLLVGVFVSYLVQLPVSLALGCSQRVAFVLLASTVLVVGVTLTPQRAPASVPADVDPLAAPPGPLLRAPWHWWPIDERTLNVLLFVPLGVAIALIARREVRRRLMVAALLAPLAIEVIQHVVSWLGRDSQWQDVVDNVVGVLLGLLAGTLLRRWRRRGATRTRPVE